MISMSFLHSVRSVSSVAIRSVFSVASVAILSVVSVIACRPPDAFDLIVRGGSVFDGDGRAAERADVGVKGDRIAFVGDLSGQSSARAIDAAGLIVAPGFIDAHGQSGTTLVADGNGESHLRQGITTEIIGEGDSPAFWTPEANDAARLRPLGITVDWTGFEGYFTRLQERGIAINLGTLVPAAAARRRIAGLENREPSSDDLSRMEAMVDQAMRDGAFGVSGPMNDSPGSFAKAPELVALARVAARHKGIYGSRLGGKTSNVFEALDEAVEIGREANVPIVIFDLRVVAPSDQQRMPQVIAKLNAANEANVRVTATMHPYAAGGTDASDQAMSEDDAKRGLVWSMASIGSDSAALKTEGVLARGSPHPRAYGTFPRVLGKYVREDGVLDLADAVRRMTSLPARQFGIQNRGYIRPDMYADLVVFDPATIDDHATFDKPHQYPTGIAHVIVNGVPVLDPKGLTGARPGRAIYGPGRTTR